MRIYMQTSPTTDKPLRFCHLLLQEDLIKGWTLIRELGNQGAAGQVVRSYFISRAGAEQALLKERNRLIKRGFRVMLTDGSHEKMAASDNRNYS